jgi:hypothetical protein
MRIFTELVGAGLVALLLTHAFQTIASHFHFSAALFTLG